MRFHDVAYLQDRIGESGYARQARSEQTLSSEDFMDFAYTILYVDDVTETLAFYTQAFGCKQKMKHESGDYGELCTGTTTLAFASRKMMVELGKTPSIPKSSSPSFEIAFTTHDVATAVTKALTAGAQLVKAPETMPWGQTIAYVTDNSGFLVELCTPISS